MKTNAPQMYGNLGETKARLYLDNFLQSLGTQEIPFEWYSSVYMIYICESLEVLGKLAIAVQMIKETSE